MQKKIYFFSDKIKTKELGLGTAKSTMREKKMKKLLGVSIMAMLAVSPMMANADPVSNTYGPAGYTGQAANAPKAGTGVAAPFATETIDTTDQAGVASAAYVKGAYNAAIRAVNTVAADVASINSDLEGNIDSQINAAAGDGLNGANGVLTVDAGNGLDINSTSKAVEVKAADTTINVSANGVKVGEITTSNVASTAKATGGTGYEDTKLSTQGYVDKKITDLDLANTYDAKGAAANAQTAAATYTDNAITALDLANTYDAAGSAATAEQNAKDYADGLASNYDAAGSAASAQAAAETAVQNKLDDGATGYDIDAKTLKIQGDSVATKAYVHTAIDGSSVSSSGTINLYNAWGATTTTPVTVNTTGTVSKAAYSE